MRSLEFAVRPRLLAVFGASASEGTVAPMMPPAKLNTGFAHMVAAPLLLQSGAIATALIAGKQMVAILNEANVVDAPTIRLLGAGIKEGK